MNTLADILALAMRERLYQDAVAWIVADTKWRPENPVSVAGWRVVRLVADVYGRRPMEVAADLIEAYNHAEAAEKDKRKAVRSSATANH